MKRKKIKRTMRYITIGLTAAAVGLVITKAVTLDAEADDRLQEIDRFIESHETSCEDFDELETVSLSYEEWRKNNDDVSSSPVDPDSSSPDVGSDLDYESEPVEPDIYAMDVWALGSYLYGISAQDTTRSLILISYEAYGPDSPLSYYVACACWTRATNNYLGADNLYKAFGGMDPQYNVHMDSFGWEAYAEEALRNCYLNPMYITGCNGVDSPEEWIYAEDFDGITIFVW